VILSFACRAVEYVPKGQAVQTDNNGAPIAVEYLPATQAIHELEAEACTVVEYCQGTQALHPVEATGEAYVPETQFLHVAERLAPMALENVPEGHAWHKVI
jgi:hypothetical protein